MAWMPATPRGRVTTNEQPGRERGLIEAVAITADRLLAGSEPPPFLEALAVLAVAADLSRLALVAARPGGDATTPRMESRQQWVAPGIARLQPGPDGWPRYPTRWLEELARGTAIAGPTRAFPADERALLEAVGARSVLFVPVGQGADWYGHLCLHDTRADRTWSSSEVEAFRAAAVIIGSAIHQRRVLAEMERRAALIRAVRVATSLLLEAGNWRQALPRVLDGIRSATRSRSAWAYGPDPERPGRRALLLYEVLAPGANAAGGRARSLDLDADAAARLQVAGALSGGPGDEALNPLRRAIAGRGGTTWAAAPMILEPGSVGLVGLEVDGTRTWSEGELEALEIIGSALKAAIRRSGAVGVPIVANPWGRSPATGEIGADDVAVPVDAGFATPAPPAAEDAGNPR
jgi:GAF domain-containing protein